MLDDLPAFPGTDPDDQLSGIVRNLKPVASRTGRKLRDPEQPIIRWLMEAGLRAIEKTYLTHDSSVEFFGYDDVNALFGAISVDDIMKEFASLAGQAGIDVGTAHRSRIISRWEYVGKYQADLVRYIYRPAIHALRMREIVSEQLPQLLALPFGELVGVLAAQESTTVPEIPILRLRTALPVIFPNDLSIRSASAQDYRAQVDAWAKIYGGVLSAYGLSISGADRLEDIAIMFNTVVEGGFVRRCSGYDLASLSDGESAELRIIRYLVSQLVGISWPELAVRRAGSR